MRKLGVEINLFNQQKVPGRGVIPFKIDSLSLKQRSIDKLLKPVVFNANSIRNTEQRIVKDLYSDLCLSNNTSMFSWFDIGCRALGAGLDSVASDCYARCEQLAEKPEDIAVVLRIYKSSMDDIYKDNLKSIANSKIEDWFRNYEEMLLFPEKAEVGVLFGGYISEIDSALNIGEGKYKPLVEVMNMGLFARLSGGHYYVEALKNVITDPSCYDEETRDLLIRRTIQVAVSSKDVSFMRQTLEMYKDEQLQKYIKKDFVAAYSLFVASQMLYDEYVPRYYDICKSLDEEKFMALYQEFYQSVYDEFVGNPKELSLAEYLVSYNELQMDLCYTLMADLYNKMIDGVDENNAEYLTADKEDYKQAILYLAEVSDTLAGNDITPLVIGSRLLRGCANAMFEESAHDGCKEIMDLYTQLKSLKDTDSEYLRALLVMGTSHANYIDIYQGRTKEAEKMIKEILPLIKKCEDVELVTISINEVICFYERHGKTKEVKKMRKLLANRLPAEEAV